MPGYIGFVPQFEPISLQEYLAVPTQIISEYKEAEKEYNETATKAEALKALLGERNADNEAGWQIVDKYESLVKDAADAMAATGIQGPQGYRQAKKAGTYYRQNMLPLESGINALQTDEKELRARDKDGTLVRKRKYNLNDYIKNPNLRSDSVLGSSIQAEAMKAAATASARKKTEPIWGKAGGNQYHSITTTMGFSPEEVQNWMLYRKTNPDKVSPELNEIYNQIAKKFTDAGYDIKDIDDYITRGIYDGIAYDNKVDYQKNLNFVPLSERTKIKNKIDDSLAQARDAARSLDGINRSPLEFNIGFTGKDLNNLQLAKAEGNIIKPKRGFDLLQSMGIVGKFSDKDMLSKMAKNDFDYLIVDAFAPDGTLKTAKKYAEGIMNNNSLKYLQKVHIIGQYTKAYQELIDMGFDVNKKFAHEHKYKKTQVSGKTVYQIRPESERGISQKEAFENFENYVNELYNTNSNKNKERAKNLDTQFGFYTYKILLDDEKDFLQSIPKQHIHKFKGITRNEKGEQTVIDGGKADITELLKLVDRKEGDGKYQLSYHPKTKSLIFNTLEENPNYYYVSIPNIDRTLAVEDYTNFNFEEAEKQVKMLSDKINEYEEALKNDPNNYDLKEYLNDLYSLYISKRNYTEQAYNVFIDGFSRSFLNKLGKRNMNTAQEEKKR